VVYGTAPGTGVGPLVAISGGSVRPVRGSRNASASRIGFISGTLLRQGPQPLTLLYRRIFPESCS
jgi:hypothetical protein